MVHNEFPEEYVNFASIILGPTKTGTTAGTAGRIILSGSKIWFDNGTSFEVVTSA